MERISVLAKLRDHQPELKALGVSALYLFGSTSRNEAELDSDIDLFFDYDHPRFSLIELATLKNHLATILHASADVMSRNSLHPVLKSEIESNALRVF